MNKLLAMMLALVLCAASSIGAPVITSITSGESAFVTGDTITINGTGFGFKGQAAPMTWYNFEGGASIIGGAAKSDSIPVDTDDGAVGTFYNRWANRSVDSPPFYSNSTAYSGDWAVKQTRDGAEWGAYTGLFTAGTRNIPPTDYPDDWFDRGFVSAKWYFVSPAGTTYKNASKALRLLSGINAENNEEDIAHGYPEDNLNFTGGSTATNQRLELLTNAGAASQDYVGAVPSTAEVGNPDRVWVSMSLWGKLADTNASNGFLGTEWNGVPRQENGISNNPDPVRDPYIQWGKYRVALWNVDMNRYEDGPWTIIFDDIYADSTLARVVAIDDVDTTPTAMNVQIPIYWTDTQIKVVVNAGTGSGPWANDNLVNITVYDRDGSVSNKHPITLGGTVAPPDATPGPPGAPTNLTATEID